MSSGSTLTGLTSSALSGLAAIGGGSPALGVFSRTLSLGAAARGPSYPALRNLDLGGTRMHPPFVRSVLAAMPELQMLALATGRDGTTVRWRLADGGLIGTPLPQLQYMRLGRAELGLGFAAELVEHCPRLSCLRLAHCRGFDGAFAATLRPLMMARPSGALRLHQIELFQCSCSVEELQQLSSVVDEGVLICTTSVEALPLRSATSDAAGEQPGSVDRPLGGLRYAPEVIERSERKHMQAWEPELVRREPWSAALWADHPDACMGMGAGPQGYTG